MGETSSGISRKINYPQTISDVVRTSVKRVVVTSSCAAVLQTSPNPQTFSEKDWNEKAVQQVKQLGKNASNFDKYRASKTLAEKGEHISKP
jgi:nucleoside-diphosphate-sugar epimerase